MRIEKENNQCFHFIFYVKNKERKTKTKMKKKEWK
jgi:hypothetical protein